MCSEVRFLRAKKKRLAADSAVSKTIAKRTLDRKTNNNPYSNCTSPESDYQNYRTEKIAATALKERLGIHWSEL